MPKPVLAAWLMVAIVMFASDHLVLPAVRSGT